MRKLTFIWFMIGVIVIATKCHSMDRTFQDFIFDTRVVPTSNERLKDDLSFLFVDLKYDNQIKICEFGTAKAAGLGDSPTDLLVNGTSRTMYTPYWPSFWQYLTQLNLPVWCVGMKPRDHRTAQLNLTKSNEAWDTFTNAGGKHFISLKTLEQDESFKNYKRSNQNNYAGLVIYKPTGTHPTEDYFAFRKRNPQFFYLDEVGAHYAVYKTLGASVFNTAELQPYKPRWKVYQKRYTSTLTDTVLQDIRSDMFVIKPINALCGHGIIMVTKEDLDETLKYICKEPSSIAIPSDDYENHSHTYKHWKTDKNDVFMVEEYCPSQPLYIHNKYYDPTIRMYFTLRHEGGNIFVNVFGGYYKIPVKALSDEGSLTEKHKTVPYYKAGVPLSGLTLPEELLAQITDELKDVLPKIYRQMLLKHVKR